MNPKVSIISPCWNGEEFIRRMLDSVLNQTYKNIELICVNDGSNDKTEDIILDYTKKFLENSMELVYIKQENKGQAEAINTGLRYITGEFLSWIDCDDFLTMNSIEKKVEILLEKSDYSIVTSDLYVVNEENINKILYIRGDSLGHLNYQENQFYLTLKGKSIMECNCHMIRVRDMKKINDKMQIFSSREGQNYQLLLPMYYYYKRYYINEPLAYYVIRKDSHFHKKRTTTEWIERYQSLEKVVFETLRNINIPEEEINKYIKLSIFNIEKRRMLEEDA